MQLLFSKVGFAAIAGGQVKPMRNIGSVKKLPIAKSFNIGLKLSNQPIMGDVICFISK